MASSSVARVVTKVAIMGVQYTADVDMLRSLEKGELSLEKVKRIWKKA